MHKSGKVLMIIGGVICLVGIIGFVGAGAALDPGTSNAFSGTSGEFYNDDLFYSIYTLEGTCESLTVTLTNVDSGLTYDILHPDGFFTKNCVSGEANDIGDYIYVGKVEPLSPVGAYTVNASSIIYITDDTEAAGGVLAGAGIGMISFCCGGGVILLGIILGLTIKDNNAEAIIMQQPGAVPMMGQPQAMMGQPQAMMGQPQAMTGQPQAMTGQPQVVATGAANPAAMNYYNSMLQQGYDPNTALAWTVQSYPGWHP